MSRFERVRAFAIHVFTATGAGLALLALVLATGGHWAAMFFVLGAALLVDGIDGPLARAFNVAEVLPRWSGDTLDLVIDFTTYVFVPAYAIAASGLLPHALSLVSGVVICMTGALYFADRRMKTDDNYFRGFPALWNLAAFYLYILEPPEWIAATAVFVLAALSFAPSVSCIRCGSSIGGRSMWRCWPCGPCSPSWRSPPILRPGPMSPSRCRRSRSISSRPACCARPHNGIRWRIIPKSGNRFSDKIMRQ